MEPTTITRGAVVNVVIVDGAPFVRERLRALLHTDVPQVDVIGEAADAQAAIRLIRDTRPDAVILDLQLPGGSGFNVLRAVKLAPPAPIVIVLTNLTTIEYHAACLEAGAEFFLDKSFGLDLLTDILGHLVRRLTSDSHEGDRP
jgi:DNA-binding NarL/FixJ family response regulator